MKHEKGFTGVSFCRLFVADSFAFWYINRHSCFSRNFGDAIKMTMQTFKEIYKGKTISVTIDPSATGAQAAIQRAFDRMKRQVDRRLEAGVTGVGEVIHGVKIIKGEKENETL